MYATTRGWREQHGVQHLTNVPKGELRRRHSQYSLKFTRQMPKPTSEHACGSVQQIGMHASGRKRVVFERTPKMSTYLLAFVVGEFDFVQGRTAKGGVAIRVYTPPGKTESGRFSLDVAMRCLDLYDEYFDVPYPLPKLDMVAIPEFAAGAMENWGLVT